MRMRGVPEMGDLGSEVFIVVRRGERIGVFVTKKKGGGGACRVPKLSLPLGF